MSLSSPLADPGFFGKDDFVPFIGQVEDVNDPKLSGRVKVRCIGWHPKEVKDLPTDDLPWARVGMPTTHAQIGRVGGKHGLLPGSWVVGFFLDGHDAQNPFVLSSFNATSNSTEKSNTKVPKGNNGKLNVDDGAYGKTLGPQAITNNAHKVKGESESNLPTSKADISGDNPTHNALKPCEGGEKANQSLSDYINTETENGPDTKTSLSSIVSVGDSRCGASAHAIERIQAILKEFMPNDNARFVFNDVVYSSVTGQKVNMNSITKLVSKLICDVIKDSIEVLRGFINDTIQRPLKSTMILGATTREPAPVKLVDVTSKILIDTTNKLITEIINALCDFIYDLLQMISTGGKEESGNNSGGAISSDPLNTIGNVGAQCVSELIMENVLSLISAGVAGGIGYTYTTGVEIASLLEDLQNTSDIEEMGNIIGSIEDILGGLGLNSDFVGQSSSMFAFITNFKFTTDVTLFATFGPFVLDFFNALSGNDDDEGVGIDGCNKIGTFLTAVGATSTLLDPSTIGDLLDPALGGLTADFGGLPPGSNTGTFSSILCDEARGTKIPGRDFPSTSCKADVITVSVPSSEPNAAQNFINGIANGVVIKNPGCEFYFGRGDKILYDISALFPPDDVL